ARRCPHRDGPECISVGGTAAPVFRVAGHLGRALRSMVALPNTGSHFQSAALGATGAAIRRDHQRGARLCSCLLRIGRRQHERASNLSRAALDLTLSPSRTQWAYEADIQFLSGDYAGAVEAADRANDVLWGVAAWRTAALAHLGRNAEAAAEGQRFLSRARAN